MSFFVTLCKVQQMMQSDGPSRKTY